MGQMVFSEFPSQLSRNDVSPFAEWGWATIKYCSADRLQKIKSKKGQMFLNPPLTPKLDV